MFTTLALLLLAQEPFTLASTGAQQALVVTTDRWDSVIGQLKRMELVGTKWMQVGQPIEIVVGEGGMGWGLGLHPLGVGEPRKTEGDGRAPAGVFALSSAFGRGAPPMKTAMPWLSTTPELACVDDPKSSRYNRLIQEDPADEVAADGGPPPAALRDYKTAERMLRDDGLYDVGVLVDHNALGDAARAPIAGRGSCVFLHVWRKKGRGSAGCTAMARWDIEKVLEWLDPAKKPVLVQLPRDEMIKRRLPWGLP
jgi:L,D-peptidoglycan transpeptidase YkuD (ErfK/YbiS/YcfS/YnhG family)